MDYLTALIREQDGLERLLEEKAEIDKHDETTSPFFVDDSQQL